jgi:hypothetical protein
VGTVVHPLQTDAILREVSDSDRVIIEYNRYGPQGVGAIGSQLKDRSAGTVIRYNDFEQAAQGWDIDLVEPQDLYDVRVFTYAPLSPFADLS